MAWDFLDFCSTSCGTGTQTKKRVCEVIADGEDCVGTEDDFGYCNAESCFCKKSVTFLLD